MSYMAMDQRKAEVMFALEMLANAKKCAIEGLNNSTVNYINLSIERLQLALDIAPSTEALQAVVSGTEVNHEVVWPKA